LTEPPIKPPTRDEADRTAAEPDLVAGSPPTVGTGSALGIGCLIALIVFVIVAIVAKLVLRLW
jgi:hypothetical protein